MSSFIPHFDLPFRFGSNGHALVVDQDTIDDVSNCVEAIVRTPQGWRDDAPSFGLPDPTFELQPIDTGLITDTILQQEPRAAVVVAQHPDTINQLIADVTISASLVQEVSNG